MRIFSLMLLISFSSYAADAFKSVDRSDLLQVLGQCLSTVHNAQEINRNNDFVEDSALYALFSAWYKKDPANHKRICIDGSEIRRAFQQFLNASQPVSTVRLHYRKHY